MKNIEATTQKRRIFLASRSVSRNNSTSASLIGPLTFLVRMRPFSFPSRIFTLTCVISPATPVLPTICTSRASEDATTLLSELEDGRLPRLPIEVRNRVSPDDGARLEQLKAQCPASHASNAVDLDVATRLLSQPASLAKAIALADSGTKVAQ